ncbi:vicilin-like seed storage protein At2g18540 [Andrographis paniculata]|uniref:vicilin-like seed storage protein At2g18540 n=1 Tax=Andrographis paniculata TaxID=175694 RepID=UPI0021E76180|nr:vicilin-like seed storage protein At2g18540 [Andrographis paniculata]
MAKDRNGGEHDNGAKRHRSKSKSELEPDPDSNSDADEEEEEKESRRKRSKHKKSKSPRRRRSSERDSDSLSSESESDDGSSDSEYSEDSDSEEERRRRRKERKRREEKREKRRREKEKDKKRKRKEEKKRRKRKDKKKETEKGKTGAVTNSWGKYGIIRETDMWNKRPEFTAWLAEVKQVNLESLPNWEEKQLFKDFMEDHNTATFPSKKYYNLDAYYQRKMEKEMKKGVTKVAQSERTVFNDEEQRRQELLQERERQKAHQVEELKRSMQSGMAQAMKEQAQLREEMAYQYKLGNFEAAAAIQRRLDPDVAM